MAQPGGRVPRTLQAHNDRSLRRAVFAIALLAGVCLSANAGQALDATWKSSPGTNIYNTGANWSTGSVPGSTDTAFFGTSDETALTFTTSTTIGGWTFNIGAEDYDFTSGIIILDFTGAGIVINGGSATITNNFLLQFFDTSTAGSATIINNNLLQFFDTSTAGSATIINDVLLQFLDTSTAGSATIINNNSGRLIFENTSSGGQARFINNAGGSVDISQLSSGGTTAGSIEGAGTYFLGSKQFTVGSNNLSTEVSGVIQDGGQGIGTGGSLVKVGTGTLTLSGVNTYTGPTDVNAGTLVVNGSIVSSLTTVASGATLGGTGSVGAVDILSGGIYAPGNSIGTMTVNGDVSFAAGSIYQVEVNAAGQGDQIIVNGTVNLTGSLLRVLAANGNYDPSTDYLIIDNVGANAVVGTFASVTSNLAFLTPTVAYAAGDGNDVVLTLERNATLFSDVADTRNQRAVAGALDRFPTGNSLFLAVLNQTEAGHAKPSMRCRARCTPRFPAFWSMRAAMCARRFSAG